MTRFSRSAASRSARLSARRVLQMLLRRLAQIEDGVLAYCVRRQTRRGPKRMLALVPSGSAAQETAARLTQIDRGGDQACARARCFGMGAAILLGLCGAQGARAQTGPVVSYSPGGTIAVGNFELSTKDCSKHRSRPTNESDPNYQVNLEFWAYCQDQSDIEYAIFNSPLILIISFTNRPAAPLGSMNRPEGRSGPASRPDLHPKPDLKRRWSSVSRKLACRAQFVLNAARRLPARPLGTRSPWRANPIAASMRTTYSRAPGYAGRRVPDLADGSAGLFPSVSGADDHSRRLCQWLQPSGARTASHRRCFVGKHFGRRGHKCRTWQAPGCMSR